MQHPPSPDATWPIVLPFIGKPQSALDLGCGSGHWLASLKDFAPQVEVLGLNIPRRTDAGHFLSESEFKPADLTAPLQLGRKFDLAICIEVAEHLPASAAETIVDSITSHADVALFSAAMPGQGGEDHFNEQWPDYWTGRFATRGFQCFDVIRPLIWENKKIALWYRQNMMLFFKGPLRPKISGIDWGGAAVVHPEYWLRAHKRSIANLVHFIKGETMA